MKPPVLVLTGPTGSGKSALLYSLPASLPIEIIGADSRQVYRQMPVGTALPPTAELEKFPHHLVNFLSPDQSYSAGQFSSRAREIIGQIISRQKIPVIAGGTFFYIKSLWDGLLAEPQISEELRQQVSQLPETEVSRQLQEKDPLAFERIAENDHYRQRRALLVILAGGRPFSSYQLAGGIYDQYDFASFYLNPGRQQLYTQINQRTRHMFESGLWPEIKALLAAGYSLKDPALKTIGYREILEHIAHSRQREPRPEDVTGLAENEKQMLENLVAQKTRNFAKRQLTWFRHEPRLLPLATEEAPRVLSDFFKNSLDRL